MKKALITLISLVLISLGNISFAAEDEMMMKKNLENVTSGKEIRGIVTSDDAIGYASAEHIDGTFMLHAEFSGLTDPQGEDFYEGWLVRKSPFAFISTGELYKKDGKYYNRFESEIDYGAYDFYVLTLEPNDGDDAPADHIFEGTVAKHVSKMMKKEEMQKETMMKDDAMKMNNQRTVIKAKIQSKVKNLSERKIEIILERVKKLRIKLETLNITAEKKENYNEILDIFVEVLESDEMMMGQK